MCGRNYVNLVIIVFFYIYICLINKFFLQKKNTKRFLFGLFIGLSDEIASAVIYFASDESAYTTGQILTISGGFGLATPIYGDLADKKIKR